MSFFIYVDFSGLDWFVVDLIWKVPSDTTLASKGVTYNILSILNGMNNIYYKNVAIAFHSWDIYTWVDVLITLIVYFVLRTCEIAVIYSW